jgi:hypothetical protein
LKALTELEEPIATKEFEVSIPGPGPYYDLDEPIRRDLEIFALSNDPSYEALSYVWGNPTDKEHILLDGCDFYITSSLKSALKYLRSRDHDRLLWVDAVCN